MHFFVARCAPACLHANSTNRLCPPVVWMACCMERCRIKLPFAHWAHARGVPEHTHAHAIPACLPLAATQADERTSTVEFRLPAQTTNRKINAKQPILSYSACWPSSGRAELLEDVPKPMPAMCFGYRTYTWVSKVRCQINQHKTSAREAPTMCLSICVKIYKTQKRKLSQAPHHLLDIDFAGWSGQA